jgi:hypothetical protein
MEGMNLPDYLVKSQSKDPSKQSSDIALRKKKAVPEYRIKIISKSPAK